MRIKQKRWMWIGVLTVAFVLAGWTSPIWSQQEEGPEEPVQATPIPYQKQMIGKPHAKPTSKQMQGVRYLKLSNGRQLKTVRTSRGSQVYVRGWVKAPNGQYRLNSGKVVNVRGGLIVNPLR